VYLAALSGKLQLTVVACSTYDTRQLPFPLMATQPRPLLVELNII